VDPQAFAAALDTWHDFYLAVASASAALLGLLFVGVSINLAAITAAERPDLRAHADLAFSNLLYLLGLSLVILVPGSDASTITISFSVIATLGLLRILRRAVALARHGRAMRDRRATFRRLGWTVAADVLLLYVAVSLAGTGDAGWLIVTPIVVGILLLGAADVSWDLLVRESDDSRTRG
jgi:hypothetical protein